MSHFGMGIAREAASSSPYSQSDNREPFYYPGSVALPAIGASAVISQFPVPRGKNGMIWKMGFEYVGPGFVNGSGQLVWQIFRDPALTKGVKGFTNLLSSIGSFNNPLELPSIRIYEAEVLSLVVKNVSLAAGGTLAQGVFVGWFYPKAYDSRQRWP